MSINPTKMLVSLIHRRNAYHFAITHEECQTLKIGMTISSKIINIHLRLNVLPNGKFSMKINSKLL